MVVPDLRSPFFKAFRLACGVPILVLAAPLYEFTRLLSFQVATGRVLATLIALSAIGVGLALVVAAVSTGLRWRVPDAWRPWLEGAIATAAALNLAQIGLWVVVSLPGGVVLDALIYLSAALAIGRIWLSGTTPRRLIVLGLLRFAMLVVALPWFGIPQVVADYRTYTARLPAGPWAPTPADLRPDRPRHVVLVILDSASYLRTSLYDPRLKTTPHLRALAAESTWFTNCHTAGERTMLSMPTVLTGVPPDRYRHHIHNRLQVLREGFMKGLGGYLAPAGYQNTFASMLIDPSYLGLKREFRSGCHARLVFRDHVLATADFMPLSIIMSWLPLPSTPSSEAVTSCADNEEDVLQTVQATFRRALDQVTTGDQRTFTWVHLGAPHSPFIEVPPEDFGRLSPASRYRRVTDEMLEQATADVLPSYRKTYDAYFRFADHELGAFVQGLKARKAWDDTLLIVMADHGEGLSPGATGHLRGVVTEELTHIPLVIHRPGQRHEERRTELVGSEDLVPTVLDQVYRGPLPRLSGQPLLRGPVRDDRALLTWALTPAPSAKYGFKGGLAVYQWPYKLTLNLPTERHSLYRLDRDPEARQDLAAVETGVAARLHELAIARIKP